MRRVFSLTVFVCLVATTALILQKQQEKKGAKPDFEMTASYIEACSCDMFCPCYFNTHSTNHMSMARITKTNTFAANLVLKVDKGIQKYQT